MVATVVPIFLLLLSPILALLANFIPEAVLISFLITVPPIIFFTNLTRNPYYVQIMLLNVGIILIWTKYFLNSVRRKEMVWCPTVLDKPLMAFFITITISIFVAYIFPPKIFKEGAFKGLALELYHSMLNESSRNWLLVVVNWLLVYWMCVFFILTYKEYNFYFNLAFLTSLIASIYGILQYLGIELIWPKVLNPFGGRCVSTFGNPNFLSPFLIIILSLLLGKCLFATRLVGIYFFIFWVNFLALLCTLTRSSWIGFVGASFTMLFFYRREILENKNVFKRALALFIIVTLTVLIFPRSPVSGYNPSIKERIAETFSAAKNVYPPLHQRFLIWSCAWDMLRERPLLGKGWGLFELFYPFYQGKYLFLETYRNLRTHANNAHNEILEIASQAGLIGLGIFILVWVVFFSYVAKRINYLSNETKVLVISSLAGVIGVLLDNLLNVSLHFVVPAFFFWLCVGACVRLTTPLQNKFSYKINNILPFICIAILLYVAVLNIRFFIGEIYYFSGFKYSKTNKLDLAEDKLSRARNFHLHEVNNNYELGNTYARKGKLQEALFAYDEALKSNLGYDEIYFNMASVYSMLGMAEKAIINFRRALHINPLSQEAYLALGSLYLRNIEKYTDEGINLFNTLVKLYPQNKDAWNNLGYLYLRKNEKERAALCFKKALEIDPSFELARRNLFALSAIGKEATIPEQTQNKRKLFSLLKKEIESENWQAALPIAKEIISIDPLDLKARLYLGNIYFSLKRYHEAVEEYKKILSISPQNVPVMLNLGIAYYEMNNLRDAKNILETILKIDPKNEIAAQLLDKLKKYE